MIEPTPGRIVWFYPDVNDGRTLGPTGPVALAAIVAKVIHERCVNLTVCREDGNTFGAQNVVLLQDGFTLSDPDRAYAEWMPFQKGQAAKYEAQALAAGSTASATAPTIADPPAAAPAPDLEPVHAKIDDLAAKVDQVLAAPAPDLQPVHDKIAGLEAATQTKFEELGAWLMTTLKDIEARLNQASPPTPPAAPATTAIGASDAPGANLTAEGEAASAGAGANGYVVAGADANPNVV
jgi:hypothetical protein